MLFLVWVLVLSGLTLGQEPGPGGVKVVVREDSDVVLSCSLSTKESIVTGVFDWKKDEGLKEVFLYDAGIHYNNGRPGQSEEFKGRVSHFPDELKHGNASIIIRNTTISDSGNYSCVFPRLQTPQRFYINLVVAAAPKPRVTTINATSAWALLQCDVHGASLTSVVQWRDGAGTRLPAEETRTPETRDHYHITLNTTVTQTGRYRCVVTREEISHQTQAEIFVHISAAIPEPYIKTLNATSAWADLQCEVRGATPRPKLEWRDGAGNPLPAEEPQTSERGGSFYITLVTTVNQTGRYRCVATQEEISHQTQAEIFVHINGKVCEDSSSEALGWVGGLSLVALVLGLVLALLVVAKIISVRCNKGSRQQGNGLGNLEKDLHEEGSEMLQPENVC
ncbi:butyrophilin subfamily 2 member A2-like isoform X1 [Etheostoma cragini]|uniref:butyrophilin subfamily 2 member A2-like isoform X1 n=1 Tax=Etheostoma cragini TaxID=417921 RepID=UPI00155F37AE|nr:butyrophilin subfamily 2 member A2-like isoform X1 [Etheostoma cragini]